MYPLRHKMQFSLPRIGFPLEGYPTMAMVWAWSAVTTIKVSSMLVRLSPIATASWNASVS